MGVGVQGPAWMSQEGSKWLVNGYSLYITRVYWGAKNPMILTFDPIFLGHPSGGEFAGEMPVTLGGEGGKMIMFAGEDKANLESLSFTLKFKLFGYP